MWVMWVMWLLSFHNSYRRICWCCCCCQLNVVNVNVVSVWYAHSNGIFFFCSSLSFSLSLSPSLYLSLWNIVASYLSFFSVPTFSSVTITILSNNATNDTEHNPFYCNTTIISPSPVSTVFAVAALLRFFTPTNYSNCIGNGIYKGMVRQQHEYRIDADTVVYVDMMGCHIIWKNNGTNFVVLD